MTQSRRDGGRHPKRHRVVTANGVAGLRSVTLIAFVKAITIPMGDAVDVGAWLREFGLERYEQAS